MWLFQFGALISISVLMRTKLSNRLEKRALSCDFLRQNDAARGDESDMKSSCSILFTYVEHITQGADSVETRPYQNMGYKYKPGAFSNAVTLAHKNNPALLTKPRTGPKAEKGAPLHCPESAHTPTTVEQRKGPAERSESLGHRRNKREVNASPNTVH